MAAHPPLGVLVLLSAALFSAGCISGEFFAADIPLSPDDERNGWELDSQNGGEEGVEPVVSARWHANVYADKNQFVGSIAIISVSDVPVFDEQEEIEKRVQEIAADQNVRISNPRPGTGSIRGDSASYKVYDARTTSSGNGGQEAELTGYAIDIAYTCGANGMAVRVFGVAITKIDGGGLFGPQESDQTWEEVVGTNLSISNTSVSGALGGLVSKVRCSA